VAREESEFASEIYSSWPLYNEKGLDTKHYGRLMSTKGSTKDTLDNLVERLRITKVDFIKLDVDGNELDVLIGAERTIKQFRPKILIELAPYVHVHDQFEKIIKFLINNNYQLINTATNKILSSNPILIRTKIPKNGSINALALPLSTIL